MRCCCCKADQEIIDSVSQECHWQEPADPARSEVTGDHKLTKIARDNRQSGARTKGPSLAACQKDLDQKKRHCQKPVPVSVGSGTSSIELVRRLASGFNIDLVTDLGMSRIELVRIFASDFNLELAKDLISTRIWD